MRRPLVIGNWKLNGNHAIVGGLLRELVSGWCGTHRAEVVVCPSFIHIAQAYELLHRSGIGLGAQDVSRFDAGAFTGEVSGAMLVDQGCRYAIVGHSERRRHQCETDALAARKLMAAQRAGLTPILCVGESRQVRETGKTLEFIDSQLQPVIDLVGAGGLTEAVVGYEPLWAVGTGELAQPSEAEVVHAFIRSRLGETGARVRVVYGGSIRADNARDYFSNPEIDGVLVGGAALNARDFLEICHLADIS